MVIEDMYLRPPKFKVQTFKLECQCGLDSAQRILTKNILLRGLNTMCRTPLFTHSQTLITIDKEMTKAEDTACHPRCHQLSDKFGFVCSPVSPLFTLSSRLVSNGTEMKCATLVRD